MKRVSKKEALMVFENAVQYAKSRKSKWHRLVKLYVLFMDKNHNAKTTKKFLLWLQNEYNEWNLNDFQTWLAFYNVFDKKKTLFHLE
jgi:hypothetical protein